MSPAQQSLLLVHAPACVTQQTPASQPWPQQSGGPLHVARAALHTA
jgi:hypothetical protein